MAKKINPAIYILYHSLLILFLVLLSNKKSKQKIQVCLIEILKAQFFSINFLGDAGNDTKYFF